MDASIVGTGANKKKRRWKRCLWTREEDNRLTKLVKKHGPQFWSYIADHFRGRSGMSCRLRWMDHLNPDVVKMPFSKEENERLLELHGRFGNKWADIANFFPGRTNNQLKNQYHTLSVGRIAKASRPSSSIDHPLCLNKGSADLSCDTKMRLLSSSSPTHGRHGAVFADRSRKGGNSAPPFERINRVIVYANDGTSHEDSMIVEAGSAGFMERCPVPQPPQGARLKKPQFIDFLGVGNSE